MSSGELSCLATGLVSYYVKFYLYYHTPPLYSIVMGYYGFMLEVCVSICPSFCPSVRFSFPNDNLSKHQWIFTKFGMCIDIVEIWFGMTNGQISSNFGGVICPRHAHIFVSDLSISQCLSPNLVCALILWSSGLANGQILSIFYSYLSEPPIFLFPDDNLSKSQGILTKLGTCIDMKEIWFWIANGQIS